MLSLALSLCLSGLIAEAPRSATLLSPEEQVPLRARLDELNSLPAPALAPPIVLLSGAVVAAVVGLGALYVVGLTAGSVVFAVILPWLVVGLVGVAVAIGLGIAGGVLLRNTLRERRANTLERRALERKLTPVPVPIEIPQSVQAPAPMLLLATF